MIIPQPNTNLIINADSLTALKEMPENSIDSVVTDPPYGLSFMGKKWDYDVPSVELWKEVFRVLKHGGFLLSFAGTRTYHRMAVNIEDAGFEIRDMISWLYGSGFPKSLNIGKQIDKIEGNERKNVREKKQPLMSNHYGKGLHNERPVKSLNETKGTSLWEGWGTALKPACEPIVVARKPLSEKNVASNVLKWGTGGINIDGCRVGDEEMKPQSSGKTSKAFNLNEQQRKSNTGILKENDISDNIPQKRFPANLIHDGSEEVVSKFPDNKSRFFYCAKASKSERNLGCEDMDDKERKAYAGAVTSDPRMSHEQNRLPTKNNHPTVKPLKLMQYLVRLVNPKGAICLDPFLGSGTTACACVKEGMNYIGIEREADYIKIANARIKAIEDSLTKPKGKL